MRRLSRPPKGWGPWLVISMVVAVGVVYLLTKHAAFARALTAAGTVGVAVAAAGSAYQSLQSARRAEVAARRETAYTYQPTLLLRPGKTWDDAHCLRVGVTGAGQYGGIEWRPTRVPGRPPPDLRIESADSGALAMDSTRDTNVFIGTWAVTFTVTERRGLSIWTYAASRPVDMGEPTVWITTRDVPMDLAD